MLLNEKLQEAIERTQTLEGDARAMLELLDRLESWAAGLRESLAREGTRFHDLLETGRASLEAQATAVGAALREAAQDCDALAQSAARAGERADGLAERWREEATAQVEAVAEARRGVERHGAKLDAAYTDAVEGCELLDIAVTEQMAAAGEALEQYAQALDTLAQETGQAVTEHLRELRDAERNAVAAVEAFTDGCEDTLCAAGRAVYGVGDTVVRKHNEAVREFGDSSPDAPADHAGIALRMIDQAEERAARFLQAARDSVGACQEGAEAAAQAFGESVSPSVAELAGRGHAGAAEVTAGADAIPPPACFAD